MKWYFRYPIIIFLFVGWTVFSRASRLLPKSDTILPTTSGDVADLLALMCAMVAGGLLATRA